MLKQKIVSVAVNDVSFRPNYVLPEDLETAFFLNQGELKTAIYLDPVIIDKRSAELISRIEITDPNVREAVVKILAKENEPGTIYKLVYHNYWDEDEQCIKLFADALVLMHQVKGMENTLLILVKRCDKSISDKLPLEFILDTYPENIIFCQEEVLIRQEFFNELYAYDKNGLFLVNLQSINDNWPFVNNKAQLSLMSVPNRTISANFRLFCLALKDPIYAKSALGNAFGYAGEGLLEGFILLSILTQAQDSFKVAALLGFISRTTVLFNTLGISRSSKKIDSIEARERLGKALDELVPLWEMGESYETLRSLIAQKRQAISIATMSSVLLLCLYPPVYNSATSIFSDNLKVGLFTVAYMISLYMAAYASSAIDKISFKIAMDRIQDTENMASIKNNFWSIYAFEENLSLIMYQVALFIGLGLSVLFNSLNMPLEVSLSAGIFSVLLVASRYILPLFGHDENTILDINSAFYLREGNRMIFSDGLVIEIEGGSKVEVIDMPEINTTRIVDFDKAKLKIHYPSELKPTGIGRFSRFIIPSGIPLKFPYSLKSEDGKINLSFYRWDKPWSKVEVSGLVTSK